MANYFTRYKIEDRSYIAFIKKEIHSKAIASGFTTTVIGQIDIVVAELTSNLIKYAGDGELLYRFSRSQSKEPLFEILCVDKGPGITDMGNAMKDGFSTKGTLGQGLGAIERQSSEFQIYSVPNWGTIVYSRIGKTSEPSLFAHGLDLDISGLCIPKGTEEVCGDGYSIRRCESFVRILFGDGLGHGPQAMEAVDRAVDAFHSTDETEPPFILKHIHENVRRTRGLVAAVAVFDRQNREWSVCGIGNISTRLYSGIEYRTYMSYNGTVGLNIPNSLKSTRYPVERNQHLIMTSDGLQSRWETGKYSGMYRYNQFVLAGALYKDFSRGTDDSSVLIAKVI